MGDVVRPPVEGGQLERRTKAVKSARRVGDDGGSAPLNLPGRERQRCDCWSFAKLVTDPILPEVDVLLDVQLDLVPPHI
jgi:hypothetical protein